MFHFFERRVLLKCVEKFDNSMRFSIWSILATVKELGMYRSTIISLPLVLKY